MNKAIRCCAGLSVISLWLIGAVNGVYAQDAKPITKIATNKAFSVSSFSSIAT